MQNCSKPNKKLKQLYGELKNKYYCLTKKSLSKKEQN